MIPLSTKRIFLAAIKIGIYKPREVLDENP
jgi:hypothetical protein